MAKANRVIYYLVKDMVLLYTIEKPGLNNWLVLLINNMCFLLESISLKMLFHHSIATPEIKLQQKSAMHIGYYSATADLWLSKGMKPYLLYTIHYINEWEMQRRCLQTMFMLVDHTGKNLAEAMQNTLEA